MAAQVAAGCRRFRRALTAAAAGAVLLAAACGPAAALAAGPTVARSLHALVSTAAAGPNLGALAFVDADHGWMAGPGVILATSNGGASWRRQYSGSASIEMLDAVDGSHVWALAANRLLATTDGGRRWSARSEPGAGSGTLRQVAFVSATLGWGLTGPRYGPASHLVRTGDGGRSWTRVSMPPGTDSVCFTSGADGWAAGGVGIARAAVYRTTDGALRWRRVLAPSGAFGARVGCSGSTAFVLAIGGSGMSQTSYSLWRTADGGRKWTAVMATSTAGAGPAPGAATGAPRGPGSSPGPMAVIGARTVAFFGTCEACGTGAGTVQPALTTDGGHSWRQGMPVAGVTAIGGPVASFVSASRGWLLGEAGEARPVLLRTSDGGATWQEQYPTSASSPLYAVSFVSAKVGFGLGTAGEAGAVLKTVDGGLHWVRVGGLASGGSSPVGLSFVNVRDGWAVVGAGLVRTADGGRTWSAVPVYAPQRAGGPVRNVGAVYDVAFVTATDGCLRSLTSDVLYGTADGGGSWKPQAAPSAWMCAAALAGELPAPLARPSARPAPQNGRYAGSGGRGPFAWLWTGTDLYTSVDGGARWTRVTFGGSALDNFSFADARDGWSLLWDGRLYATTDGGARWREVR